MLLNCLLLSNPPTQASVEHSCQGTPYPQLDADSAGFFSATAGHKHPGWPGAARQVVAWLLAPRFSMATGAPDCFFDSGPAERHLKGTDPTARDHNIADQD